MITLLADHNIEGQARELSEMLIADGWADLLSIKVVTFSDMGLDVGSTDRDVWLFAQQKEMMLLTDNRNMKGKDSLERTIREVNTKESLPVITIGSIEKITERSYRKQCVGRLCEIIMDLENYLGTGRIFIP